MEPVNITVPLSEFVLAKKDILEAITPVVHFSESMGDMENEAKENRKLKLYALLAWVNQYIGHFDDIKEV
jgi:hypothetical protein